MPSPADAATLQSIFEGVTAARDDAEAEWGAERLPLLVGDDLRAKLRRQQQRWSEAYEAAWTADMLTRDHLSAVESAAGGMKRAWSALAAAASEAGHRPLHVDVLGEAIMPDGSVAVIVRGNDDAAHVAATGRACAVYTLAEVFHLIGTFIPESLQLAKVHFPGAVFTGARAIPDQPEWRDGGDDIPFGEPANSANAQPTEARKAG